MKKLLLTIYFFLIFALNYNLTAQDWTLLGSHIPGEAEDDFFGITAAISRDGTTVAIGSTGNNDGGMGAGHVRVYSINGSSLAQVGIDINGLSSSETIGKSVAINENGSVIAVGASGGVRVYEWNEELGFHIPKGGKITTSSIGGASYIAYGSESLALSSNGNTLLIGVLNSGMVVFDYNGSSWVKRGTNNFLGRFSSNDKSGNSVAMSADGNIIALGAPAVGFGTAYSGSGGVKAFKWVDDEWNEMYVSVDNDHSDETGYSIALSEDASRLVVASKRAYGSTGHYGYGKVEVFELNASKNQYSTIVGQTIYGETAGQEFGNSVAISSNGNVIAVSSNNKFQAYQWNGYFWSKVGQDVNYNIDAIAYNGQAISSQRIQVDLSGDGNLILVGDPDSGINGSESGIASVYNYLAPPEPKIPVLNLDALYESQNGVNITINATPVDGWPTSYTYQWYYNNFAIPALYGGVESSIIISGSDSSNGTYKVDVANTTGSVTGQFEFRVFVDNDGDGLSNYRESNILNTNPNSVDTDGDSLSDSDEINVYYTDPSLSDSNGDGFDDGFIITNGFDKDEDYNAFLSNTNVISQSDYDAVVSERDAALAAQATAEAERDAKLTLDEVKDLRAGSTMIAVENGTATLSMEVEESDDLGIWTNGGASTLQIPIDAEAGKKFFRFKMAE